jgi:hypothetical protein
MSSECPSWQQGWDTGNALYSTLLWDWWAKINPGLQDGLKGVATANWGQQPQQVA